MLTKDRELKRAQKTLEKVLKKAKKFEVHFYGMLVDMNKESIEEVEVVSQYIKSLIVETVELEKMSKRRKKRGRR